MANDATLDNAVLEIRTSDAIAVVGAGASFLAGMPLAGQLPPLVWHTLDAHPTVMQSTCDALGVLFGNAKDTIGLDWSRIQVGFSQIAADPYARRTFQFSFAQLDRERASTPSPVHTALARLVHCGRVLHVISLNWDTLLEAAFRSRYGIDLNAQGIKLWKPHGDCLHPEDDWILPHEPGSIPSDLVERMTALAAERPRTLLIVGYSERDDVVTERLIRPLANRWRVFRIIASATGEGAIPFSAQEALGFLVKELCPDPELRGWEYVSFANQRGIEAAVSGERLGPLDVDTCPRLPHFDSAARTLELLHTVEIAGCSGCGKSITAWQLARECQQRGWEVLRPNRAQLRAEDAPDPAIRSTPWKRILVVDDTQIFPAGFADQLADLAGPDAKVIRATTDATGERSNAVRIPAKVAVEALTAEFRHRRAELLPIVRRYDSHVGDGYMDTSLEHRLDEAAKADTPWQFAFALRGGWRQAREELNVLRDFDRADLLLLVIAARQLLSLDAGCAVEEVAQDVQLLSRGESWAAAGLDLLRRRAAILPRTPLRCPHMRFAAVVIRNFFTGRKDTQFTAAVSLLRAIIKEQRSSLQGISWLLDELLFSDAFRVTGNTEWDFLSPRDTGELVQRCYGVTSPLERRDAAHLLSRLIGHGTLRPEGLAPYFGVLKRWLETADGISGYGIGTLVNNLYNADKHAAQQLLESIDPGTIAAQLRTARCADGYVWGYFLGRLAAAAEKRWRDTFTAVLPRTWLLTMTREFKAKDIVHLSWLLVGIAHYDLDFATECLNGTISTIGQAYAENPLETLADTRELRWIILGENPFARRPPTSRQRRLSRQITNFLPPRSVVSGIVTCRYGDWEPYAELLFWIRSRNPRKHREIVDTLDWQELENRTAKHWQRPPRELRLLLDALIVKSDQQPVREWVARHADLIDEIDPIIAGISPEAAVAVVRKGGRFNLAGHNGSDWKLQTWALARVAKIAKDLAVSSIETDLSRIVDRLARLEGIDCEEIPLFLRFVDGLAPDLLVRLFKEVDVKVAAGNWPKRLQENRKEVSRGAREVFRIARDRSEGALKALAELLSATKKKPISGKQRADTHNESDVEEESGIESPGSKVGEGQVGQSEP